VHEPAPAVAGDLGLAGPRLQDVMTRALAKEPEERYPTAAHLADDLADILTAGTRQRAVAPDERELEEVGAARRLIKDGQLEESHRRLREVARRNPDLLEARRALRTVGREMIRRQRVSEPETEDFPELEATFQAALTRRTPETEVLQPTVVVETGGAALPAATGGRVWLVAGGIAIVATVAAGLLLLRSRAPGPTKIAVHSAPSGAAVLADGRDTGVVTDGEVTLPRDAKQVVLAFRKSGYREETRTIALPVPPGHSVAVTLSPATVSPAVVSATVALAVASDPAGATVSLDGRRVPGVTPLELRLDPEVEHVVSLSLEGHRTQEARLSPGRFPTELKASLESPGPLGQVVLSSSYPVDVIWRGRVMAKAQASSRFALPVGRQVVTVTAPAYFLRTTLNLDVRVSGETTAEAPRLGRLNIRASPDNCQVFIDGVFVDYPPIVDKAVAAGSHKVTFKWPDGVRKEETVQMMAGAPAYVTGRRD